MGSESMTRRAAAVLIAGPTASGKSRLALEMAAEAGGVIINADSMQVYRELRVLTARPSAEDETMAPHRLYGHVSARERYSVGRWLADIATVLAETRREGRMPILVGGTGLYFKALTEGLSSIPPIPPDVRAAVAEEAKRLETPALHSRLSARDPEDASAIRPSDRSRILRALEVFTATGRALAAWNRGRAMPVLDPALVERRVLDIDRALLHRRIGERAEAMVAGGALAEAQAIAALGLDAAASAMKAIGVRELLAHVAGDLSLDEAVAAMKTETRRYARRQLTWFRNQMADWPRVRVG
jgi:tRNA dimethylallyltransferase